MDFLDFHEARKLARSKLPRGIFEYIDRGTEGETAIAHNRKALDEKRIVPRVLRGAFSHGHAMELFGREVSSPLVIAPTAFAGLVRHRGDIALGSAARDFGIPFCVATESIVSVEEIADEAGGDLWFQLYMWEGQENWQRLLDRAAGCSIKTLVFTVDTPVFPKKVFNLRNGFGLPVRFGWRNVADVLSHPSWALDVLGRAAPSGGLPRFAPHPDAANASLMGRGLQPMKHQSGLSWQHLRQVREYWRGSLVVKGILSPNDAMLAVDHGADGIVVSSHGMRNFDSAPAPIDMLPAIRDAAGAKVNILADSGIQRGSDILKLLQAGADAVMLGRSMLYALAASGKTGAIAMLKLLMDEFDIAVNMAGADLRYPGDRESA